MDKKTGILTYNYNNKSLVYSKLEGADLDGLKVRF